MTDPATSTRRLDASRLPLESAYPVHVGAGLLDDLAAMVEARAPNHRYAFIADATVEPLYGARARHGFPEARTLALTVPSGEAHKSRAEWLRLTDALLAWGAGRDTTVIALGGGVVGDLAGFVAATLHRGVPVVQVPTTLLAMVDSSVGGKTGVDTAAGKNLVGAFHDPSLVVADTETLATLPSAVRADGLAEMIKHGLIASPEVWEELFALLPSLAAADDRSLATLPALVRRSVSVKVQVVVQDARESGLRQILNAGHTIGHAIEHTLHYTLSHGSAVAAGLVIEARLSERLGLAESGLGDAVAEAVRRAGLPDGPPEAVSDEALLAATRMDKKARSGAVEYALPVRIGQMSAGPAGRWSVPVDDASVLAALSDSRRFSRVAASARIPETR